MISKRFYLDNSQRCTWFPWLEKPIEMFVEMNHGWVTRGNGIRGTENIYEFKRFFFWLLTLIQVFRIILYFFLMIQLLYGCSAIGKSIFSVIFLAETIEWKQVICRWRLKIRFARKLRGKSGSRPRTSEVLRLVMSKYRVIYFFFLWIGYYILVFLKDFVYKLYWCYTI